MAMDPNDDPIPNDDDYDSHQYVDSDIGDLTIADLSEDSICWLHNPGIVFGQCRPKFNSDNCFISYPDETVEESFPPDWCQGIQIEAWTGGGQGHRIDPCLQPHRRWTGDKDWRDIISFPLGDKFSPSMENPFIRAAHHTHLRLNRDFLLGEIAGWLPKLRFGVGDRVWARWIPPDYDETKDYGDDVVRCAEGEWAPGTIVMPYWRQALTVEDIAENKVMTEMDHQCWLRHNGHYPFRNAAGENEKDPLVRAKRTQDAMRRALPPEKQSYKIMAYQILLDPTDTVRRVIDDENANQGSGLICAFMDDNLLVRSELSNGRKPPLEFVMDEVQEDYMQRHMFAEILSPSWWMMPGGYTLEDLCDIEDVDILPGNVGHGLVDIELLGIIQHPTLFHPDLVSAANRRAKYLGHETRKRTKQDVMDQMSNDAAMENGSRFQRSNPFERLLSYLGREGNKHHAKESLRLVRRDGKEKSECVCFS